VGKITEKLAKSRKNQNNLLKIEKLRCFEIADCEFVLSFSKNKMADSKWRFEILQSLSILIKFSNGAVFRSMITNLVLVQSFS
jgi:hypothetical protein